MIQEEDGVFRCRRQPRHEFRVMRDRPVRTLHYSDGNMACPACGAEMQSEPDWPGLWVCSVNPAHMFDLHPPLVCEPPSELIRESALLDRATAGAVPTTHWLAHIGITSVLLPPPQGNTGDGTYCQFLGGIKPGGGSKNSRKRKKQKKFIRGYLIDFEL